MPSYTKISLIIAIGIIIVIVLLGNLPQGWDGLAPGFFFLVILVVLVFIGIITSLIAVFRERTVIAWIALVIALLPVLFTGFLTLQEFIANRDPYKNVQIPSTEKELVKSLQEATGLKALCVLDKNREGSGFITQFLLSVPEADISGVDSDGVVVDTVRIKYKTCIMFWREGRRYTISLSEVVFAPNTGGGYSARETTPEIDYFKDRKFIEANYPNADGLRVTENADRNEPYSRLLRFVVSEHRNTVLNRK